MTTTAKGIAEAFDKLADTGGLPAKRYEHDPLQPLFECLDVSMDWTLEHRRTELVNLINELASSPWATVNEENHRMAFRAGLRIAQPEELGDDLTEEYGWRIATWNDRSTRRDRLVHLRECWDIRAGTFNVDPGERPKKARVRRNDSIRRLWAKGRDRAAHKLEERIKERNKIERDEGVGAGWQKPQLAGTYSESVLATPPSPDSEGGKFKAIIDQYFTPVAKSSDLVDLTINHKRIVSRLDSVNSTLALLLRWGALDDSYRDSYIETSLRKIAELKRDIRRLMNERDGCREFKAPETESLIGEHMEAIYQLTALKVDPVDLKLVESLAMYPGQLRFELALVEDSFLRSAFLEWKQTLSSCSCSEAGVGDLCHIHRLIRHCDKSIRALNEWLDEQR